MILPHAWCGWSFFFSDERGEKFALLPEPAGDIAEIIFDNMESISADCQELKVQYDLCFNNWFKDSFLKGKPEDTCAPLFKVYQTCVKNAIKQKGIEIRDVEKPILGTEEEKKPTGSQWNIGWSSVKN